MKQQINAIEKLNSLEKKIYELLKEYAAMRARYDELVNERCELIDRLTNLESSLAKETKNMEDINQERAVTKLVVDDLISSIDKLVEPKEHHE